MSVAAAATKAEGNEQDHDNICWPLTRATKKAFAGLYRAAGLSHVTTSLLHACKVARTTEQLAQTNHYAGVSCVLMQGTPCCCMATA